jgi:hypothetical protein
MKKYIFILLAILVLVATSAFAPRAQEPSGDILVYVQLATAAFAALIGWPALLSTLVTAAEYFGWLSATVAEKFVFWANVLVFGGIFVAALLGKIDLINVVDSTFGNVAKLLVYVLIILGVPMGFNRAQVQRAQIRSAGFFQARLARLK